MKKILSIFIFLSVMFFNLKMDVKSKNVTDIQLENVEALACYYLSGEGGPLMPDQCCSPWYYYCYSFGGYMFEGWPVYN